MEHDDSIPLELGDFQIIRELGQGVMGVVYEAQQNSQNRRVALKALSHGLGLTTGGIRRFRQELEAASRLQHSSIVPVYSFGELGLVPYYEMQLVEGPSLERVIRRLRVQQVAARHAQAEGGGELFSTECPDWAIRSLLAPTSDPAEWTTSAAQEPATESRSSAVTTKPIQFEQLASKLADVADALAYAHDQGVHHRNLKPSNLLLSPDGRWMVVDFGLARSLEQPGMTLSGEFLGLPHYLPPEQISREQHPVGRLPLDQHPTKHHPVDHRADIYALGVVLYELSTLHKPFDGETRESVCARILHDEALPLTRLDPDIPQDLETICMKAMEKDPNQRYQTAGQLAGDLRRFAKHQGITAQRVSLLRQSTRWYRRHWAISAAIMLTLVAIGFSTISVFRQIESAKVVATERLTRGISSTSLVCMSGDEAAAQRKIEEADRLGAEPWVLNMLIGQLKLFSGHPTDAMAILERALRLNPDSIEAQALLEVALQSAGRSKEAQVLEAQLWSAAQIASEDRLTIRDQLLLGSWISRQDPRLGLAMAERANEAANRAESTLARLYLAQARGRFVQDTGDPTSAETAAREAQLAREMLRTNSFAYLVELQTLSLAEVTFRTAGHDFPEPLQVQAQETLESIQNLFPDSQANALSWFWQGRILEDPDLRLQAFQKAIDLLSARKAEVPGCLRQVYAMELYLHDELPLARQELQSLQASGSDFCEILTVILTAEDQSNLQVAQETLNRLPPNSGIAALHRPLGLLMLGQPAAARELYQQLNPALGIPTYRNGWYQRLLAYCTGTLSAEDLLTDLKKSPSSNLDRNQAHFFVAMRLLSEGRRNAAKEHFEECLLAGVFTSREYQTSRTLLKKLETNSDWPAWIPKSRNET